MEKITLKLYIDGHNIMHDVLEKFCEEYLGVFDWVAIRKDDISPLERVLV